MSQNVTFNGVVYPIPVQGDPAPWGTSLTTYLVAIAAGAFQKSGGSFTLTSEADFGASFGLKALYYKSRTTNPAAAGQIRLANTDKVSWRNFANGADLSIALNASDLFAFDAGLTVTGAGTFSAGLSGTTGTFSGAISATAGTFTNTSNQLVLGTTRTVTITAPTPASSSRTWTIPDITGNGTFMALEGTQTVSGSKTFSAALTGVSATWTNTTNQITLGTTNTTTINSPAPAASRTWLIPDLSTNPTFAALEGTQTFSGSKTFSSAVAITATSNHLVLSTSSNTLTLSAAAQATSARTWTIPDISGNGTFMALEGTQTVTGNKTFSGTVDVTGLLKGKGTSTNDSAAAGYIGEYVSSTVSTPANFPTSGNYGDITSITLSAGNWSISGAMQATQNGATWTTALVGISTTTGNSSTGLVEGDNALRNAWASSSTTPTQDCLSIPDVNMNLSGSTIVYLKQRSTYSSGGPPQAVGRISAVRVR